MRVWSLPALLSIASGEAYNVYATTTKYGVTQPTAYHISHGSSGAPDRKPLRVYLGAFPAAQVARGLRTGPPVLSVYGADRASTSSSMVRTHQF